MQASVDSLSPQIRTRPNTIKGRRRARRRSDGGRIIDDPVRAWRLRLLLQRCVIPGFVARRCDLGTEDFPADVRLAAAIRPSRGAPADALVRQVAIYLAHVSCGLTYTAAAGLFGRNRSTAAHACAVVEERRDDPHFDRLLENLELCVRLGFGQIEPDAVARRGVR